MTYSSRDRRGGYDGGQRGDRRRTSGGASGHGNTSRGGQGGSRQGGRGPRDRDRPANTRGTVRVDEPALPEEVTAGDLDPEVRRDLLSLDKANAETVARHLVMVMNLLGEDPLAALRHARAARDRAGRVGVVRETAGIAAYTAGEWQEALGELRTARRLTGSNALLPLIADCERGLGRPERAIDLARSAEGRALTGDEATEMLIVESGARLDLGEPEKAIVTLQAAGLKPGKTGDAAARLFYAYATALLAAQRRDDAITWFMNAAAADVDDVTDAELRLVELASDGEDPAVDVELLDVHVESVDATVDAPAAAPAPTSEPSPEVQVPRDAAEPVQSDPVPEEEPEPAPTHDVEPEPEPEPSVDIPVRSTLAADYDALLLDLDGTVFEGSSALPGAIDALAAVDVAAYYVTNNASRRAPEVAAHLVELGFSAKADQVVTSAQAGARLLAQQLPPGSRALVVGTDGLAQEVRAVGIGVTRSADDRPDAVIQGHSPDTNWAILSEAVLAVNNGARWIACNVDATLPSERGMLIGNGSMVAAVANATGKRPVVAGKPATPLMADAIERSGANRPLVVGDRLDTDIEGAVAVGVDCLLVLTGVSTAPDLLSAVPVQRPTFVTADLRGLLAAPEPARIGPQPGWAITATVDGNAVRVDVAGSDEAADDSLLPAVAAAVWAAVDAADELTGGYTVTVATAADGPRRLLAALGVR